MRGDPAEPAVERSVRFYMSEGRYAHTLGVRRTAVRLAGLYRCDPGKAALASLLHDVARDMPLARMQRIVLDGCPRFSCAREVFRDPLLLHAPAGCVIAREDFGVRDREVLRSIELHTTGGPSMGILEKVVFVADFIEPGRRFRGVKRARALAGRDLDETVLFIYGFTIASLVERGRYMCERTILGYNELIVQKRCGGVHGNQDQPAEIPDR